MNFSKKYNTIPFLYYFIFFVLSLYIVFILVDYNINFSLLKYSSLEYKKQLIKGIIINKIKNKNGYSYVLKTIDNKFIYLKQNERFQRFNLLDRIEIITHSRIIDIGNSYERYLYNSLRVDYLGYISEIIGVEKLNKKSIFEKVKYKVVNYLYEKSFYLKDKLVELFENNLNRSSSGVLLRMFLGYKDTQNIEDVINDFRDAGVIHVLVVSGLNVGYIFVFVDSLLKLLFLRQYFRDLITILAILFYAFITGFEPPVSRATIIVLCMVISNFLMRKNSIYHSIAISALFILFFNERNLFNPSFLLSYSAFFGIVFFYDYSRLMIYNQSQHFNNFLKKTIDLILVTISAQLFVFPLVSYYFGKISVIGIISNIFVVPISAILLWITILVSILASINHNLFAFSFAILEYVTKFYLYIVHLFSKTKFLILNFEKPDVEMIVIYYLILIMIKKYFSFSTIKNLSFLLDKLKSKLYLSFMYVSSKIKIVIAFLSSISNNIRKSKISLSKLICSTCNINKIVTEIKYGINILSIKISLLINILIKNKQAALLCLIIIIFLSTTNKKKYFSVIFLGTDNSRSVLIKTLDNKTILIDCVSNESYLGSSYLLAESIKNLGMSSVDHLIITHPHYPNYIGLGSLAQKVNIKNIILNIFLPKDDYQYKKLFFGRFNKFNLDIAKSIKVIKFKDGYIKIVPQMLNSKMANRVISVSDIDENSLLIELKYKDYFCIFSNDLPIEKVEKYLQYNNKRRITIIENTNIFKSKIVRKCFIAVGKRKDDCEYRTVNYSYNKSKKIVINFTGNKFREIKNFSSWSEIKL